jgi:hypothetical protein
MARLPYPNGATAAFMLQLALHSLSASLLLLPGVAFLSAISWQFERLAPIRFYRRFDGSAQTFGLCASGDSAKRIARVTKPLHRFVNWQRTGLERSRNTGAVQTQRSTLFIRERHSPAHAPTSLGGWMATTFQKRQKEMKRQDKARAKAERRSQKKTGDPDSPVPVDDGIAWEEGIGTPNGLPVPVFFDEPEPEPETQS